MLTRPHRSSPLTALAALAALVLAACGEPAAPPAKTADNAPPPAATETTAPPAPPAGDTTAGQAATAAAPAPDPAVDGYVFKKKLPAVGSKFVENESKTMSLTMNVTPKPGAKPVQVVKNDRESVEKTVEVLAVSADAVTKVKVTYKEHSKIETEKGVDTPKTSPVSGKSYIVEGKNGTVTVLSDKGAPVPEKEAKEVRDDFKSLGRPDRMQTALPDGPIKVGDKVDSLAQALRDRMSESDDGESKTTVENSTITLASVNDKGPSKTGVFSIQLDLVMDKGDLVIRMKMAGEVEARMEDGMPVSMSFQAPITVKSSDKASGPKITGAGMSTMSSKKKAL